MVTVPIALWAADKICISFYSDGLIVKIKLLNATALLLALVLSVFGMSQPAYAASDFDNYNPVTDELVLESYLCSSGPVNVSTSWSEPILEYVHSGSGPDPYAGVKALLLSGSGYVVHQTSESRVEVTFSSSPNAYLQFRNEEGLRLVELVSTNQSDTLGGVVMDLWDDCALHLNGTEPWSSAFNGYGAVVATHNPAPYDVQKILFSTIDVVYPQGYEGVTIPSTYSPPTLSSQYVALGDSYSSGLGSFNYDIDTSTCYRSSDAYSFYVADELELDVPILAACASAQTYDIAHSGMSGQPQRDSLDMTETEYVTLTIGGNDVGFASILEQCVQTPIKSGYGCSTDSNITGTVASSLSALGGYSSAPIYSNGLLVKSIAQVLLEIEEYAPNASIFIDGYPSLFGTDGANYLSSSTAPGNAICPLVPGLLATVSYVDAQWMNSIAVELNAVIQDEVESAQLAGVDVEYVAPVFGGHAHCDSSSSWLNEVVLDTHGGYVPSPESFHPTSVGAEFGYGVPFVNKMTE